MKLKKKLLFIMLIVSIVLSMFPLHIYALNDFNIYDENYIIRASGSSIHYYNSFTTIYVECDSSSFSISIVEENSGSAVFNQSYTSDGKKEVPVNGWNGAYKITVTDSKNSVSKYINFSKNQGSTTGISYTTIQLKVEKIDYSTVDFKLFYDGVNDTGVDNEVSRNQLEQEIVNKGLYKPGLNDLYGYTIVEVNDHGTISSPYSVRDDTLIENYAWDSTTKAAFMAAKNWRGSFYAGRYKVYHKSISTGSDLEVEEVVRVFPISSQEWSGIAYTKSFNGYKNQPIKVIVDNGLYTTKTLEEASNYSLTGPAKIDLNAGAYEKCVYYYYEEDMTSISGKVNVTYETTTGTVLGTDIPKVYSYKTQKSDTIQKLKDFSGYQFTNSGKWQYKGGPWYDFTGSSIGINLDASNTEVNVKWLFEQTPDAYVVATGTTNPTSQVIDRSDVNVKVIVDASLKQLTDVSKVSGWTIKVRKKGDSTWISMNKPASIDTIADFDFTIPKTVLGAVTEYTQYFDIEATATFMDNSKKVTTATCSSGVYKLIPPPALPENKPPIPVINCDAEVQLGEELSVSGSSSYDPDGSVVYYKWSTPGAVSASIGNNSQGQVYYSTVGTYTIKLNVWDDKGLGDTGAAYKTIKVVPPKPTADIKIYGKLRENRGVIVDTTGSFGRASSPLDKTKTMITITPVNGTGSTNKIYYVNGYISPGRPDVTLSNVNIGTEKPTFTFENAGEYDFTVTVYNSMGISDTKTVREVIKPDLDPIADYTNPLTVLRDQSKENSQNYAIIKLTDLSYSPDGDPIKQRIWYYKYDSDNDGDFTDEAWIMFDDGNNINPELETPSDGVGRYIFRVKVIEDIVF